MKIGVDARSLSRPITGIGRYTLEMCKALSRIEGVSLYLYSSSPISKSIVSELGLSVVKTHFWSNGLLAQMWAETYLPIWAKNDGVDIFWGASHRLPRFLSNKIVKILTIHDLAWIYAKGTMRLTTYFLERLNMPVAVRKADFIVTDSLSTKRAVISEFGISSQNISTVYLAPSNIQPLSSIDLIKKKYKFCSPYFIFVGTLEPRKNLRNLLLAYSDLSTSEREISTLVVVGGKGWGGIDLQSMVSEMGLLDNVVIMNRVDDTILATLYCNAQFLVMPSLYEGFGLPLVESMFYGTPVMAANNSSMPEIVGNAGLLVDASSVNSISSSLRKMITDRSLRKHLSKNASQNVKRFNWDRSAEKLVSVFEKAALLKGIEKL